MTILYFIITWSIFSAFPLQSIIDKYQQQKNNKIHCIIKLK